MKKLIFIAYFFLFPILSQAGWVMVDSVHYPPGWDAPYELRYESIDGFDDNHYIAIGNMMLEMPWARLTSDGGNTWSTALADSILRIYPIRANVVAYPDTNLCIIVGDSNYIWRSTDECKSWEKNNLNGNHIYNSGISYRIKMYNGLKGSILSAAEFFLTVDGGETWVNKNLTFPDSLGQCYFIDVAISNENKLIVLFIDGKYSLHLMSSNDWGDNWIFNDTTPRSISRIDFINENEGWACGGQQIAYGSSVFRDIILHTTDCGQSWEIQLDTLPEKKYGLQTISFVDKNNGVALGLDWNLWKTNNGGKTWILDTSDNYRNLRSPMRNLALLKNLDIIGVSENERIYKYINETSVKEEPQLIKEINIKISPNPSSDFIEIAGLAENENWEIFNVLGIRMLCGTRELAPLPYTDKQPISKGASSLVQYTVFGEGVKIDISAFPPGVYFLRAGGKAYKFIKF